MSSTIHIWLKYAMHATFLTTVFGFSCQSLAETHHKYQQGILLEEQTDFPCGHECGPFETVYVTFCVQSGDSVLLARLFDTRFNYDPRKFFPQISKTIEFRSDETNLWLLGPNGKELRVKQNYSEGIYNDSRCVAELHRRILKNSVHLTPRPADVALDAVYVPASSRNGYWTKCFLAPDRAIVCFARGPKGEEFSHVYQPLPQVRTNSDLAVDTLRTNYDTIVLKSGETLVRKYD